MTDWASRSASLPNTTHPVDHDTSSRITPELRTRSRTPRRCGSGVARRLRSPRGRRTYFGNPDRRMRLISLRIARGLCYHRVRAEPWALKYHSVSGRDRQISADHGIDVPPSIGFFGSNKRRTSASCDGEIALVWFTQPDRIGLPTRELTAAPVELNRDARVAVETTQTRARTSRPELLAIRSSPVTRLAFQAPISAMPRDVSTVEDRLALDRRLADRRRPQTASPSVVWARQSPRAVVSSMPAGCLRRRMSCCR